ncbi:MAG: hypothetical protein GTO51_08800 [Candidatus Latescibacteria bacterium]|nr:hypothetical protein [Candidatus Latescibacterota bacterium]NIM22050.1 hypothetical protein [Candidatus Latescibacterota bacterium]NIM66069.1 hypothetical protein [Candidatus Latescibacterota bacterium]NIO02477.1 hypothetical protein [Candidatus Latescibacterota bacterium]NIO29388.1 hypothetical protein [Candidatus Latescibacterota bacterium]
MKHYPSKKDGWFVAVIWGTAALLALASYDLARSSLSLLPKVVVIALCLAAVFFGFWVLYSTSYKLTNQEIIARCGPFRYVVSLTAIDEVRPSRSTASSPACSLDRFSIKYRGSSKALLISPVSKLQFLHDLVERCPHLRIEGNGAVRARSK